MNDSNYDGKDLRAVADEITEWQYAAQQWPLTEVTDTASGLLTGLAEILNTFNDTCRDDGHSQDALAHAVTQVARQATAAAIFTLGLNQRVKLGLTAQTN